MDLDTVVERLEARVATLAGKVEKAGEFSRLMQSGKQPSSSIAAYVLPGPLRGSGAAVNTGLVRQGLNRGVTVALMIRAVDQVAGRALDTLTSLLDSIVGALVGWSPGTVGVFELVQGRVASVQKGLFVYLLDFSVEDQLRVETP